MGMQPVLRVHSTLTLQQETLIMARNWNWTKNEQQGSSRNAVTQNKADFGNLPMVPTVYFKPIGEFYQDVDRLFDNAFRQFGFGSFPSLFNSPLNPANSPLNPLKGVMFNPSVDISSTDKEYAIEVEVPGLSENDIRIDLARDGQLTIYGEKRLENDNQDKNFHRVERSYGSFTRTLLLPEDVDQDSIEANFENGVLKITASRLQNASSKDKRIEINSGSRNENARGGQANRQQHGRQDNSRPENTNTTVASANPKRAA
jgi:HSP20 family protein